MKIELFPLEKAVIDGQSLFLGSKKSDAEALLGPGEPDGSRVFYFDSCLCIEYDSSGRAGFIEVSCNNAVTPVIYGLDVSGTDAEQLTELLKEKNGGGIDDSEGNYSHTFQSISTGIFREITPEDCAEMAEEMRAEGISTEDNADFQADVQRASRWASVGIGIPGYYRG